MSEATPMPVEPPTPSTQQLAVWQALVERIRQGDRAEVLGWDAAAAGGPGATYQVLVTQQVHQQLRHAPPLLAGSVAGILAVLRVDPTEASMIFRRRRCRSVRCGATSEKVAASTSSRSTSRT